MSAGRYTPCRLRACMKSVGDRADGFCCAEHHETYLRVVSRHIQDRLAAKVIRQTSSDEGSGTRLPDPSPLAAAVSSHGTALDRP